MADIQVLLTDDANRQALASLVDERHTPITKPELQAADAYLVDDASFPQYHDALRAHKREHTPVFSPVVLIRRDRTSITIDLSNLEPDERPFLVDEVLTAPVDRQTLFQRLTNLLARRQQTKKLQARNERLEQFASLLKHELRNPLNVLYGYLEVARERETEAAFERCWNATSRMERMIEDTALMLRKDDPDLDRDDVDLATVCQDAWEMVPSSAARLETATSRQIHADEDRLVQLLANLFRNAVEHGGENVTVTVGNLTDGFYVEDDGVGIPPEGRENMFEEGYSTLGSSSGVGLSVVETVCDHHGWTVQATDGSTGGARFEITGVTDV